LREEIEGVRVHDGEAFRGELVEAAGREVFVERKGRVGQFTDTPANPQPEGFLRATPPDVRIPTNAITRSGPKRSCIPMNAITCLLRSEATRVFQF
jgi:hypothetical protein